MIQEALYLLLALNTCHWAADFTQLSRPWMLKAKAVGWPLGAIALHAAVHGALMAGVVALWYGVAVAMWVFVLEWGSHFLLDVSKGQLQARFSVLNDQKSPYHWWLFGADQWAHQAVIVGLVYGVLGGWALTY